MNMINNINKQTGIVLIFSMIILVVFTILGISTMNMTKMGQKQAANMQDQDVAFSAAENALGCVEVLLQCAPDCTAIKPIGKETIDYRVEEAFDGSNGLYHSEKNPAPYDYVSLNNIFTTKKTGIQEIDACLELQDMGVNTDPVYMVEYYKLELNGNLKGPVTVSGAESQNINPETIYRVVTKGTGAKDSSTVMIESFVGRKWF